MKIIVALILLFLFMLPSEIDIYQRRKALEKQKKNYELYKKYLEQERDL